jgi:hypothetical protein
MVEKVFCKCTERLIEKLEPYALSGEPVNMEARFSQLTLDVIGLSLFNYNFDSLTTDSPVIDAVYTALKEAELRSTDLLPYWKVGSTFDSPSNFGPHLCLRSQLEERIYCLTDVSHNLCLYMTD